MEGLNKEKRVKLNDYGNLYVRDQFFPTQKTVISFKLPTKLQTRKQRPGLVSLSWRAFLVFSLPHTTYTYIHNIILRRAVRVKKEPVAKNIIIIA